MVATTVFIFSENEHDIYITQKCKWRNCSQLLLQNYDRYYSNIETASFLKYFYVQDELKVASNVSIQFRLVTLYFSMLSQTSTKRYYQKTLRIFQLHILK